MSKKLISLHFMFSAFLGCIPLCMIDSAEKESFRLILDKEIDLKEFRKASDPYMLIKEALPMRDGLDHLTISGSAQFSYEGLKELKNKIGSKRLVVMDLRRESHGFINGLPVSWISSTGWSNLDKSSEEIKMIERDLLENVFNTHEIVLTIIRKDEGSTEEFLRSIKPITISTEAELCEKEGVEYFRLPVEDHMRPRNEEVDRLIQFLNSLDKDTWIHFHCKGGKGRTSTLMVMYDIIRNAKSVPLDAIIARHELIGSVDITNRERKSVKLYPTAFEDRSEFIKRFYNYCKDNQDGYKTSWTQWSAS